MNALFDKVLHRVVKDENNMQNPETRFAVGKLSGRVGIVCNLLLAGSKLLVGLMASSVAIMADGLNNLSDAASSIVTLIGFRLAEKPADEEHPFGHARFEYLSGLVVSELIILIGFELAKNSAQKILHPAQVKFSVVMVGVLLFSILVKFGMFRMNAYLGKLISSNTLEATAQDSRNDIITTGAVLAAALIDRGTGLQTDGYIGLAVALFILYSGAKMAKETISPLLGENTNPELQKLIVDQLTSCPKVLGCHDLMVHDYGPGQRFASVHVEMDKNEDPLVCHELIDGMERACLKKNGVHLVIHYDPVATDDPEADRMKQIVTSILQMRDEHMSIHDFRMVPGEKSVNLIFDVALPISQQGKEKEIQNSLEAALNNLGDTVYHTVITFDAAAFNCALGNH